MAVGKCKECGGQVASSAKVCPHCGAKGPKKVGVLGWLFVMLVVLPIGWWLGSSSDSLAGKVSEWAGDANRHETAKESATSGAGWVDPSRIKPEKKMELCGKYAELAKTIMEGRQHEVPMQTLMEVSDSEPSRAMVIAAYEQPAFNTDEYRARAVSQFQNQVYLECVK